MMMMTRVVRIMMSCNLLSWMSWSSWDSSYLKWIINTLERFLEATVHYFLSVRDCRLYNVSTLPDLSCHLSAVDRILFTGFHMCVWAHCWGDSSSLMRFVLFYEFNFVLYLRIYERPLRVVTIQKHFHCEHSKGKRNFSSNGLKQINHLLKALPEVVVISQK